MFTAYRYYCGTYIIIIVICRYYIAIAPHCWRPAIPAHRAVETFENPEPADEALLRVRSGLASTPVKTRVSRSTMRSTLDNRPTRKQAPPPPRARIDNSPPPVCTRSVRLSIGHQGTMKHRSPLSNLTPSRYALRVQRLPWRPIPGHEPNADPGL